MLIFKFNYGKIYFVCTLTVQRPFVAEMERLMSVFAEMMCAPQDRNPRRNHHFSIAILVAVAVVLIVGIIVIASIISSNMNRLPTPSQAAQLACKTTHQEAKFSLMATTGYKLTDVGKPSAVIIVPSCFVNSQVPSNSPDRYVKDVDVYIIVTHSQLHRLFTGSIDQLKDNYPYSLGGPALDGLIDSKLRASIDTDPTHVMVSYFVTSGPMPTKHMVMPNIRNFDYLVAPYDALTGTRYTGLGQTFVTRHPLYDAGNVIVLSN